MANDGKVSSATGTLLASNTCNATAYVAQDDQYQQQDTLEPVSTWSWLLMFWIQGVWVHARSKLYMRLALRTQAQGLRTA